MPAIASTSGRLHSEFIRLLFLQDHRETDRFFEGSGVQLHHTTVDCSNSTVWYTLLKSKCGNLRVRLNLYVFILT
jgi:hypothetical protein